MGKKAEFGTPKYVANKMKAKGLQKLRWYCQMCQKQCRDENGFKCHTTSESHQRQLLLFADNSRKYMDQFSYEFAKGYIEILKRQYGTKRVSANRVYQDYISDRHHLHMNATRWVTLTGFVKWMGRTGRCIVDQTEKGWFITYIDRDPDTIEEKERKKKRQKMDKDDAERAMEFLQRQVEIGKASSSVTEPVYTELLRENEEEKLSLELKMSLAKPKVPPIPIQPLKQLVKRSAEESINGDFKKPALEKPKTALDEIIAAEETKKERQNRKDYWLAEGIVVKVVTKSLGDEFYKKKGVIQEVVDRYSAKVKMLDTGKKLKLDQAHVETVIPAIGRLVKVVNGAYRGQTATLVKLNEENFCVCIEIACGVLKGRRIDRVRYEDISKLHVDESLSENK